MVHHGHATQIPLWANRKGTRTAITYQEQFPPQNLLAQRCQSPARDIGLQTSWSADAVGSFSGSVSWSEALKQAAYRAEFERKTVYSSGSEEHVLTRLQHEYALTQAELQATRRCIEETAVLRLEQHRSAQGELSVHGVAADRSISCGVKSDFQQHTTLILDSHPESSTVAEASSGSTVVVMAARRGTQPGTPKPDSHDDAAKSSAPAPLASRCLPHSSAPQGLQEQLTAGDKPSPINHEPQVRRMSLPAGLLDAEPSALSAAGSCRRVDENDKKEQRNCQGVAQNEQHRRLCLWQPENPLKNVSMRAAFPLGAGARGGWRMGLSQRITERLSMDAKLRGGSSRVSGSGGTIILVDPGADHSMRSTCSADGAAGRHRTFGRPSGGQIRMELKQPAGWRCSLMLNSSAQGPALECRWRGNEASLSFGEPFRSPRSAEPADAEQQSVERGKQWHSWHLSRLELPAWQRPMTASLPCMEARAVMKGLSGSISSLQLSAFMPL